ncbi:MAG: histidinol-phosphate transaminase [Chloroflexota bacterium]
MKPRPHILGLTPYKLSDNSIPNGQRPLILSQNESMFGCSPVVHEAIAHASADLPFYPDKDNHKLRQAVAHTLQLEPDKLVFGLGSTDLIVQLCMLYLEPGRTAVASEYSYIYFRKAVGMAGGEMILAAQPDLTAKSVDNILAAVRPDTTLVFIDNPGNPTGNFLPRSEIIRLRDNLPEDVLLVLDEAYAEFVDLDQYEPCFDLIERGNVVVLRTFSKVYGLAGMRVGWGYFPPEIIDYMGRIRPAQNLTTLAAAAAAAAVLDQEQVYDVREKTAVIRTNFASQLTDLGLHPLPSCTNFMLCRFDSTQDTTSAANYLRTNGIVVRPVDVYGLTDHLRITMGTGEQMDRVAQTLRDWKAQA